MRYDYELTLISEEFTGDDNGNQISTETRSTVLCGKKSISRSEFYKAANSGLKPQIIFIMHGYEYGGQRKVEFEGPRYNVIRTYEVNFEEIELTCEKVLGNG